MARSNTRQHISARVRNDVAERLEEAQEDRDVALGHMVEVALDEGLASMGYREERGIVATTFWEIGKMTVSFAFALLYISAFTQLALKVEGLLVLLCACAAFGLSAYGDQIETRIRRAVP